MDRLRLSDCRVPVARVLNVCATDASIPGYVNEAERRLVRKGKWVGTVQRYRICTTSTGCLTWPRQIETIEGYEVCGTPGTLRNGWYEFSSQGPGLLAACGACSNNLVDRGTMPTFDVPSNNTSKVAVSAEVTEAADARLLIRGYDGSGNWIRTEEPPASGLYIDGEYVLISTTTQYTTKVFSAITGVIKPITNGPVRLSQYDVPTASVIRSLAYYEADEEVPIYRASLIPSLAGRQGCGRNPTLGCNCTDSDSTQLTVIAKLRHLDVSADTDFLLLGNLAALKLEVMAILKEERNLFDESMAYEAKAIGELQAELNSFEGDAAIPTFKTEGRDSWGAGVYNAVSLGWPVTW